MVRKSFRLRLLAHGKDFAQQSRRVEEHGWKNLRHEQLVTKRRVQIVARDFPFLLVSCGHDTLGVKSGVLKRFPLEQSREKVSRGAPIPIHLLTDLRHRCEFVLPSFLGVAAKLPPRQSFRSFPTCPSSFCFRVFRVLRRWCPFISLALCYSVFVCACVCLCLSAVPRPPSMPSLRRHTLTTSARPLAAAVNLAAAALRRSVGLLTSPCACFRPLFHSILRRGANQTLPSRAKESNLI